jgi:oxygen-dependent protoporphyrinogen oxidase
VIGAGLAGLATAWRLRESGCEVALLERAARPGGRVAGDRSGGFTFEPLPALLTPGARRLIEWITAVGLRDELLPVRPVVTAVSHRGAIREVELRGLADVRRLPGIRLHQALRLVRLPRLLARYAASIDPERPERAVRLDDRSVADFCRLYFGESVLERWMEPFTASISLGAATDASRVLFLHHYRAHAHQRPGLTRAGIDEVADRAAAELSVQLGVEALELLPCGGAGVRIATGRGAPLDADAVVLATSAAEARAVAAPLLTWAEREGLSAVRYTPALVVAAALCRPPAARSRHVLVPAVERSPLASLLLEPGVAGGRAPAGRGLALLRARASFSEANFEAPSDAVEKELLEAFQRLCPDLARSVEFTRVLRVERAYPRFDVGRYREIDRFQRVQLDRRSAGRRLYFAGDYLVHPSFEGAIVSAQRAAEAVQCDFARASGGERSRAAMD